MLTVHIIMDYLATWLGWKDFENYCLAMLIDIPKMINITNASKLWEYERYHMLNKTPLKELSYQTLYLCEIAVAREPRELEYAQFQTLEMCRMAVNNATITLCYAQYQDLEMCEKAVYDWAGMFPYTKYQTPEMCRAVLRNHPHLATYAHYKNF